jgi:hypothetical protein
METSEPVSQLSTTFLLAKSYFDCREYFRCSNLLKDEMDELSVFVCYYAQYMVLRDPHSRELALTVSSIVMGKHQVD